MNFLIKTGRIFFAIAIACFGMYYLAFAAGVSGARPGPPWFPGPHWLSWVAGAALFVGGLGLLIDLTARCAALVLAVALLLKFAIIHLPRVLVNLHDPGPWTSAGEILSICGGAIVLAGVLAKGLDGSRLATSSSSPTTVAGQYLFALPLFIFGAQHIMYGRFVATLIPAWIPGHVFWAYFIGGAFIASSLAILTRQLPGLAASLLGLMFLLWVLILHSPRVAVSPHNGNEWTSAFVALAMSGSALLVAGTLANRE